MNYSTHLIIRHIQAINMPLVIRNQMFTTSLPDPNGNIQVTCPTNPALSFVVDLGNNQENLALSGHLDRIMLSTTSNNYRYEHARNPGPLISGNLIGSMKFTNVRYSLGIYWSNSQNSDRVVVKDVLGNTIMERTGLSIGSGELRDFFIENFPLRVRINTSSLNDQYLAIMMTAAHHQSALINQVSYEEIENRTGVAPDILYSIDQIINDMRREYNIDVDALTEHFVNGNGSTEEKPEVPPPYSEFEEPPSYNETCA